MGMKKWRQSFLTLGCILLWITVLRVSHSAEQTHDGLREAYGGCLSTKTSHALRTLHEEVRQSRKILEAGPHSIRFLEPNDRIKEYTFMHRALWCNRFPVVSDVESFQFEYRTGSGDRLIRPAHQLNAVEFVCYTIRLSGKNEGIMTNARIPVRSVDQHPTPESSGRFHLASIEE